MKRLALAIALVFCFAAPAWGQWRLDLLWENLSNQDLYLTGARHQQVATCYGLFSEIKDTPEDVKEFARCFPPDNEILNPREPLDPFAPTIAFINEAYKTGKYKHLTAASISTVYWHCLRDIGAPGEQANKCAYINLDRFQNRVNEINKRFGAKPALQD